MRKSGFAERVMKTYGVRELANLRNANSEKGTKQYYRFRAFITRHVRAARSIFSVKSAGSWQEDFPRFLSVWVG